MEFETYALNLAKIREAKGLSAYELSLRIGKDVSYIYKVESGKINPQFCGGENYNDITAEFLIDKVSKDKNVVVVNAGTPGAVGLTPERRQKLGQNFVDVGIAEEHAVAMSSALAKGGCKPDRSLLWRRRPRKGSRFFHGGNAS